MENQMLRYTLNKLEEMDKLLVCEREVDIEFEIGGVLSYYNNKMPMLFENIRGYNSNAVGALYGDRDILYNLLGIGHEERLNYFMDGIANPEPYKIINSGPVKENIINRNIDLQKMFPIIKHQEKDSSSFITAGVMVVKDPETGVQHTSIRRLQVNGGNELSALIASPKLTNEFLEFEKMNKPLEVAIVLGYDAEYLMASQISSATYGVDEHEVYSRFKGEPLELVKCETVDLLVPAFSEIVLEGTMVPNVRELEGPFGELMGYYGAQAPHPIIKIDCVTHRDNPLYQIAFPCREEHLSNGLIREVELYNQLNNHVKAVDVNVTEGGGYRFDAFVSIDKQFDGDGKSAIIAALGSNRDLKQVVVVDPDVDLFDVQDIEWAIATRVQAEEDIVIIPKALGSGLEPSHSVRGVTDKIGVDATKPINDPKENFERAIIPGYEKENIDIKKYFPNIR